MSYQLGCSRTFHSPSHTDQVTEDSARHIVVRRSKLLACSTRLYGEDHNCLQEKEAYSFPMTPMGDQHPLMAPGTTESTKSSRFISPSQKPLFTPHIGSAMCHRSEHQSAEPEVAHHCKVPHRVIGRLHTHWCPSLTRADEKLFTYIPGNSSALSINPAFSDMPEKA
ncbi:hypothetical protein STEG23_001262 [Scotinomys teguina]